MQVLLRLAERPGQVCSRLGLLEEVWGDAVVGEENLTRAISELRRIFGDQARKPRVIETIRNHGYRLILETGQIRQNSPIPAQINVSTPEIEPLPSLKGEADISTMRFSPSALKCSCSMTTGSPVSIIDSTGQSGCLS